MATSSFNKEFKIRSKKGMKSLEKIVNKPRKGKRISKNLTSPDRIKQGEEKLKRMLSR